jgi:outer membrane protein assembly factor BamB
MLSKRIILGVILVAFLAFQATGATHTIIPNGAAGVGSLSVINPETGAVERSLVTATNSSPINNIDFVIVNASDSAVALAISSNAYLLSAFNLTTGKITAQQTLALPLPPISIAANPKTSVVYLTYRDASGSTHIRKLNAVTLGVIEDSNLGADAPLSMTVSPDGGTIYLFGNGYTEVAAVKASNLKVIGTIPLSNQWDAVLSPNGSTLYVAAGKYPNIALTHIDTATFTVTDALPLDDVSVVFSLAISADGSQLYMPAQEDYQGTDIFTLDLATGTLTAVPAAVNGNTAVSPDGTVYVGDGSSIVVFDPASQSVKGIFQTFGNGLLALNSTGSALYFLNEFSSSLEETGAPPSETVLATGATGTLSGVAYDSTNNLLLVADSANNVEVLNPDTLQPVGQLFIPNLAYAFLNAGGGFGFATSSTPEIFRFDPVSLQVTGTASLPGGAANYLWNYSQPVLSGSTLYVPFERSLNGGPRLPSSDASAAPAGIAVIDTLQMKLTAIWPFRGLPLLGLAPGGQVAYAVVPLAQQVLDLDKIDLSTGQIVARVQLPSLNTSNTDSNPAVSPDGGTIYFSNDNTLYTFNAKTLALTNTAPGIGLVNLTVSPDGAYIYGATPACNGCAIEYSAQIVSASSLQVVGTTPSAYQAGPALFLGN